MVSRSRVAQTFESAPPSRPERRLESLRHTAFAAMLFLAAVAAHAATFRLFGSAGAETHLVTADPSSPLNPGNFLAIPYRSSSADAVVFSDVAAEDKKWKMHLKLRAQSDDAPRSTRGTLGEAYAQLAVRPWLDVTAGRRIEKWGTGYAWNPTGFLNPPKNPTDPTDRRSAYRGVDMVKAEIFVRDTTVGIYAVPHAWAARAYKLIAGTDVSLVATRGNAGASVARVFGDALELHGEVARSRALAGGQYTFPHDVNLVIEVYHRGGATHWSEFRDQVAAAHDAMAAGDVVPLLLANRDYAPLQMESNYGFVRLYWPVWHLSFETLAIRSLRDGSTVVRATGTWKLRGNVSLYVIQTEFAARPGAELDYVQVRRMTDAGLRVWW